MEGTTPSGAKQMNDAQRQIRQNVRRFPYFLLVATDKELVEELRISRDSGDEFRAECVMEIMADRVTLDCLLEIQKNKELNTPPSV